jgi:hypothetical protein
MIGLIRIRYLLPQQKIILGYCLLSLIAESISFYLWRQKTNNMPLYHLFPVLELSIFLWYFEKNYGQLANHCLHKTILISYILFTVINFLFFQHLYELNTYSRTFESLIMIYLAISGFYLLLKGNYIEEKLVFQFTAVNTGILLYFSGSLLYFILGNFLGSNEIQLYKLGWIFHAFLNIVFYCILSLSLWKPKKA